MYTIQGQQPWAALAVLCCSPQPPLPPGAAASPVLHFQHPAPTPTSQHTPGPPTCELRMLCMMRAEVRWWACTASWNSRLCPTASRARAVATSVLRGGGEIRRQL